MKKSTKILLIIAAFLVLAGALLFVCVMSANHWDFASIVNAKLRTETIAIAEDFDSISVRSDAVDVEFLPSGDGTCRVVFRDHQKIRNTATVKDGTLTVGTNDSRAWFEKIVILFGGGKITVYLPEKEYASLQIEGHTGDVSIPRDFTFERIDVSTDTGDVRCGASSKGTIRIKTHTGDIRLENASAEAIDLSVTTGRTEIRSFSCEKEIRMSANTGDAVLSDVTCMNLTSTGDTGDITLKNVIAEGMISIERDTGDVRFENCDAAEIEIETDTGDVTGSLRSGKIFFVKTDTGDVSVPETTSGGRCRISTDTGDVRITVE